MSINIYIEVIPFCCNRVSVIIHLEYKSPHLCESIDGYTLLHTCQFVSLYRTLRSIEWIASFLNQ